MEQLVIVLVLGVIAFIKWLIEKSAELRESQRTQERLDRLEREQPAPPVRAPRPAMPLPDIDAAERRLREALGLPAESEPAPIRKVPPPVPKAAFRMEEVKVVPVADLEQRTAPQPPLAKKRVPFRAPPAKPDAAPSAAKAGVQELLGSREGLRKAILAQEILGPPKGLVF